MKPSKPEIIVLTSILVILFTLLGMFLWLTFQEERRAECGCPEIPYGATGAVLEPHEEQDGEWLTKCYNAYDSYEDRIRFCG